MIIILRNSTEHGQRAASLSAALSALSSPFLPAFGVFKVDDLPPAGASERYFVNNVK